MAATAAAGVGLRLSEQQQQQRYHHGLLVLACAVQSLQLWVGLVLRCNPVASMAGPWKVAGQQHQHALRTAVVDMCKGIVYEVLVGVGYEVEVRRLRELLAELQQEHQESAARQARVIRLQQQELKQAQHK